MEGVFAFIETLNQDDLKKLEDAIRKQLRRSPMKLAVNPLFDGKLQMFHRGGGGDISANAKICEDSIHSFLIKWNTGEEMQVRVANQEGLMYAGTTKFEVEYFEIGSLEITGSFPEGDRLPSGVGGINEFAKELLKHGITSIEDIESFVVWILDNIDASPCPLTINHIRYHAEDGNLFDDYCPDKEEEVLTTIAPTKKRRLTRTEEI